MTTMTTIEFDASRLMADIRRVMLHEDAGLRDLAERADVSASTLSRLDHGALPDMQSFLTICASCDLEPGDYFKRVVWQRIEG